MNDRLGERHLCVIGASAGGIDALERLLGSLPQDFKAPIVVAQHLDPGRTSHLENILQRHTQLKVVTTDDATELKPGTVYLAPSGRHIEVVDHRVQPSKKLGTSRPTPSIDLLFASAAQCYEDCVIAVILSGMGTDGAAGARAVKEAGGTIVVQEPESAQYPALPQAIASNHVDFNVNLEDMAPLITSLASDPSADSDVAAPDVLRAFLRQVRDRSGIDFTRYKTATITRRLARLMTATRSRTLQDYQRYLDTHADAYQRLVNAFLIKVTGFFRDPELFEALRNHVLPDLISSARRQNGELRIWSAGCATGEEAYSIAILLSELLGDDVDQLNIRIFATDLDSGAIAFARRGIYPASSLNGMDRALIEKYFIKSDDTYQIRKSVRNLTVFGEYDLGQRAPFPRIDLALCRNVLIYFTKELQQRTLQLFAFALRTGGYLVLGKSETAHPLPALFVSVNQALKIFQRQGDRLLIPKPAFGDPRTTPQQPAVRRTNARPQTIPRRTPDAAPTTAERVGTFFLNSPVGIVGVDKNYDILFINQSGRSYLGIDGEGVGEDVVHLASAVDSGELKSVLDAIFRGETTAAAMEFDARDVTTEEPRYLQISAFSDRVANGKEGRANSAFLLIQEVTETSRRRRSLELEVEARRGEANRLKTQNEQLLVRHRTLTNANNELTSANNELRNSNEHLMIAAEEAEAAAEEVETLNEELQATSEELETLNEELQATVEELNTTNEELSARGTEFELLASERQELLEESDSNRDLLAAAMDAVLEPIAVLDNGSRVVHVSEGFARLANSNGNALPRVGTVWSRIPATVELGDADGKPRRYSTRSIPASRNDGEEITGRVVILNSKD